MVALHHHGVSRLYESLMHKKSPKFGTSGHVDCGIDWVNCYLLTYPFNSPEAGSKGSNDFVCTDVMVLIGVIDIYMRYTLSVSYHRVLF